MTGLWLTVAAGTALAMEYWARWVHEHVWHGPLYWVHRSHHEPSGPVEANDLFAVAHAVPAAALIIAGSAVPGAPGAIAFGIGVGMTAFGMAYALVHDGLIHGRLPVGFLLRLRWFRKLKSAHGAHHRHGTAPYGLFAARAELRRRRRSPA